MIVGIDEVGRGPWAGPLVVGAVVLNGATIDGLTDSKQLSKKKREALYQEIIMSDASIGLGWVHSQELDEIGLSQSLVEATKRALMQIDVAYHEIIIDGTVNFLKDTAHGEYVTTLKKADLLIPSVSAASIVAKVSRDEYMEQQATLYPGYGFESHVGYGTSAHRTAIDTLGITPIHRRSFRPLKTVTKVSQPAQRTATSIGDEGENVAARHLESKGYTIVARNWKTKLCEIDIVAEKNGRLFFVEVKHRKTNSQGGGLAAITNQKLSRMKFAANMYIQFHQAHAKDVQLVVVSTVGSPSVFESMLKLD